MTNEKQEEDNAFKFIMQATLILRAIETGRIKDISTLHKIATKTLDLLMEIEEK